MPKILQNKEFLKLWGNQILLQIAFNLCNYTALLIVADRTNSPFAQSQLYAALTIPGIIFGLIAGPIVDIVDRKKLMLLTDFFLAVLFLCYPFTGGHVLFIIIVAIATTIVASFFIPAEAATIPLIVDKATLDHANSFFLFTLMGSVLIGYTLAGPFIQLFGGLGTSGENIPFYLAGIAMIIGFFLRLSLKQVTMPRVQHPETSLLKKPFLLFFATVKEIVNNSKLSLPLILLIFIEMLIGMMSVLLLGYIKTYLKLPLETISYLLMLPLVGGLVIGTMFLQKIEKKYGHRQSIFVSLLGIGCIILSIGLLPFFVSVAVLRIVAVLTAVFVGIYLVFISVQARTMLQNHAPGGMHGRVFSFLGTLTAASTPVPVLVLGFFAAKFSLLTIFILVGITILLFTLLANYEYQHR